MLGFKPDTTSSLRWKMHRPAASAFKTRLPRRLQICYIKCSAVGIRCRFLWENIWPLWRTWTNIILGEFGSLLCAPLEDENISSKQAPQQERSDATVGFLPPQIFWSDCSFLIGPIHDECSLYLPLLLHLQMTQVPVLDSNYTVYAPGSKRTFPLVLHRGTIVLHWKLWFPTITLLSSNERPSCQHRIL